MMSNEEEDKASNEDEASNKDDDPFPTNALPPDFVIENVLELTEEQQQHRVTFYQAALTAFSVQASNGLMMMREKYIMIRNVLLRVQNGESLSALRRAGYSQVNVWSKKFTIVVCGKSSSTFKTSSIKVRKEVYTLREMQISLQETSLPF